MTGKDRMEKRPMKPGKSAWIASSRRRATHGAACAPLEQRSRVPPGSGDAVPLLGMAVLWQVSGVERALLMAAVLLVLIVELLNSGIEAAIDRIGTEHNALSGLAKDVASAAVTISLVLTVVVWACILL